MTGQADAPSAKAYRRLVSATELMWNASDAHTPFYNTLVIEYASLPDNIDWDAAVAKTVEADPGSAVRLRGMLGWKKWAYHKAFPFQSHSTEGSIEQAVEQLPATLHPKKGPICDVWLVRHPGGEALVLRSLHAVMDGAGHIHWANEFIRAVNGQALEGGMSTYFDRQLTDEKVKKKPNPDERIRTRPNCTPLTRGRTQNPKRYFHFQVDKPSRDLSSDILFAMGNYALAKGIDKLRVVIPSNLRTYDPSVKSTGNLTGSFNLEFSAGATQEQLAMSMITYLYKKHDTVFPRFYRIAPWIPRWLIDTGFRKRAENMLKWNGFDVTAVVSNLGELDKSALSIGGSDANNAYFISPYSHYFPMFVCITGFDGSANVTFAIPDTLQNDCDEFFDFFRREVVDKYRGDASSAGADSSASQAQATVAG